MLLEGKKLLPHEDFVYLADIKNAPYGNKTDAEISARVFDCSERLLKIGCKAIVIACNTATNVGIKMLRERYNCPFVGLEPALKPAMRATIEGTVVLLCTEATARQEKFLTLCRKFGKENLLVAPQKDLAALVEHNLCVLEKIRRPVYEILMPIKAARAIVLGCTHYIFLKDIITDFYRAQGQTIRFFDGNTGAINRLKSLLVQGGLLTSQKTAGSVRVFFD